MLIRLACVALVSALLAGCSATQLLNLIAVTPGEVNVDMSYGALPRQKLDVYSPEVIRDDTPVLLFVHGGSWKFGSKDDYKFFGAALASKGIQTVVVNYRIYPEGLFPTFVEDVALALAYVRSSVAKGRPIFLAGHSAGAQIAAMVDLAPNFLKAQGTTACDSLKGLIGIAGPYDFTPVDEIIKKIFPVDVLPAARPVNFARNPSPPVLLLHGQADTTVEPARSTEFATALRAGGNTVTVKLYERVEHLAIIGAISPLLRFSAPTLADITEFIAAQRQAGYPACPKRAGPR